MSSRRLARLNEQIRREVSEILRTRIGDPRIGIPTVTEVSVTNDLWMARVFVRPDPTDPAPDVSGMLEGLERAAPFVRRELGRILRVRRVPELRFEPDRTLENALRIERLLREVLPQTDGEAGEGEDLVSGSPDDPSPSPGSPGQVRGGDQEEDGDL